jgi:hypothetical protein
VNRNTIDRRLRETLPPSTYHGVKGMYDRARTVVHRNPGRGRVLPDFLVIGSTKCGTTSLHGWLTDDPMVVETEKEIHYFNMNYYRQADWYRAHFPLATDRDRFAAEHGRPFLAGEGTASYLAHYWTPKRAAELVPDAKLIVSLRNPVDRAYSQYHYFRRRGSEALATFEEAIDAEPERLKGEEAREIADPQYHSTRLYRSGYQRTGRYAEHVERWLEVFPREQILFLSFEREVAGAPQQALDRVHEFLGLPPRQADLPILNSGSYSDMSSDTRQRLDEYFAPHNARLYEMTGIDFGWQT